MSQRCTVIWNVFAHIFHRAWLVYSRGERLKAGRCNKYAKTAGKGVAHNFKRIKYHTEKQQKGNGMSFFKIAEQKTDWYFNKCQICADYPKMSCIATYTVHNIYKKYSECLIRCGDERNANYQKYKAFV